jgi:hypothetical protein
VAERPLSVELLHELTERLDADVFIILDQFEEQALYQPGPQGEAFLKELGHIITNLGLRVSVLLGVREDAFAKLDRLEAYVPGLYNNSLRLHHLNRAAAREAIEGPLMRYNEVTPSTRYVTIEPELIDELLTQLQTGTVSVGDVGQGRVGAWEESVETPFLQLVLAVLWGEEANRGSLVLRRATLDGLGGADRIVRTHLDGVMSVLTEQQRDIAAQLFRYLVTPSGARIAYTAEDLADYGGISNPAQVRDVLEELAAGSRVVRPVPPPFGSDEPPRYEIFHGVLVPAVLDWRRRYVGERERIASQHALIPARKQAEEELRKTRKRRRLYALLFAALALLLVMITAIVVSGVTQP